jgi:serine/threonine-protein kinase
VLPVPLPPYPVPAKRPYGEITYRGETKFYQVYQHAQGKFLSDLLLENPQLWHYQAAWIIITVAEALRPLAAQNKCHLCLTPDVILVDTDPQGNLRPLLVDLGFIVNAEELERFYDWKRLVEPAYTAPELLAGQGRAATLAADAYSLGMILYEMLAGRPAFADRLRRDDQIRQIVAQHRGGLPVERPELEAAGVVKVVEQAVGRTGRYNNVVELGEALEAIYGHPPVEKRPVPGKTYTLATILGLLLLITAGVAAFVVISALMRG